MKDWRFLDALRRETDRSLAKDPGRRPWGAKVEDTVGDSSSPSPYRGGHGTHGRPGGGGQTERHSWSDAEYAKARRDFERQNANSLRDQQRAEREERQSLRDLARERREAARDVDKRRNARDDDHPEDRGVFW